MSDETMAHHDTLFNALCDEIDKIAPDDDTTHRRIVWKTYGLFGHSTEQARRLVALRELVSIIRNRRRSEEIAITVGLAFSKRLFSHLLVFKRAFDRGDPDEAAATLATLLASTTSVMGVAAKLRTMRGADIAPNGSTFMRRGWRRVEMHLARRGGELSAETLAYTCCAGEMPWSEFLEELRFHHADALEKLRPHRGDPRFDEALHVVENANLDEQ